MMNGMNLNPKKFFLIAGPCVAENKNVCFRVAEKLASIREKYKIQVVFKASYLKANRTSSASFRGPGISCGLSLLESVREKFSLPVTTDVHESSEIGEVSKIADIIQIPAFLCRQTVLLEKAAETGLWINVKKGQFLAPWDMKNVADKIRSAGNKNVLVTERGSTFGYNNLVVDYRGLVFMLRQGLDVIFDATHSIQLPSASGTSSGGDRTYALPLACAAAAVGVKGFFFETHPDPEKALCDGPNSVYLRDLEKIAVKLLERPDK